MRGRTVSQRSYDDSVQSMKRAVVPSRNRSNLGKLIIRPASSSLYNGPLLLRQPEQAHRVAVATRV